MAGTAARQFERRSTKTRRRLFRRGPIVSAETVRSDVNGRRVTVKITPGFGDASEAGVFCVPILHRFNTTALLHLTYRPYHKNKSNGMRQGSHRVF